jgi:hypothetical protein
MTPATLCRLLHDQVRLLAECYELPIEAVLLLPVWQARLMPSNIERSRL